MARNKACWKFLIWNVLKYLESTQDYDDVVGRLRLADFLYAEYSLEEVIYQLAKVMFVQSLTQGSEPAQHALQKLTEFLESEGVHGRISPTLQKKILGKIKKMIVWWSKELKCWFVNFRCSIGRSRGYFGWESWTDEGSTICAGKTHGEGKISSIHLPSKYRKLYNH